MKYSSALYLIFLLSLSNIQSSNHLIQAQTMKTPEVPVYRKAFINGKIYTVNEKQPYAEAVVVEGNKIIFVGSNKDAQKMIDESTEVVDLKGKLMLPGFFDAHLHMMSGGFYTIGVDLRPAKSSGEFIKILKDYVVKYPGRW